MIKKQKKPGKRLPTFTDTPTPERMRQDGGTTLEVADRSLRGEPTRVFFRAKVSCRLDWYYNRKVITDEMYDAGRLFAKAFFYAGKSKRTTPMYGEFIASGRTDFDPYVDKTDAQIRLDNALKVLTQDEKDVVWDVCGADIHAGGAGRVRHLQTGLRALSVHFGISRQKSC